MEDREIFNEWRKNTKVRDSNEKESDYDMVEDDGTVSYSLPGDCCHKTDRPWEGVNVGGGDEIHESQHSTNKGGGTHTKN